MKIKQLIEKLKEFDPELVVTGGTGDEYLHEVDSLAVVTTDHGPTLALQAAGEMYIFQKGDHEDP